jgi:hypothetical protein
MERPRLKHHNSLEFVENMTLKEKARAKVNELDKRMAELKTLYENETDPEKKDELGNEILNVAAQTNKFLRMAGASEQEMYAD